QQTDFPSFKIFHSAAPFPYATVRNQDGDDALSGASHVFYAQGICRSRGSSMTASVLESDLLQRVSCPVCRHSDFEVIYPAHYPQGLTQKKLLEVYSASSERKLMDQLVRCTYCSLGYLNPRVRSDIILSAYSDAVDPTFFEQNSYRIATFRQSLKWFLRK